MINKKKIIITGSSGFLGSSLIKFLNLKKNIEVTKLNSKNCDLTKPNSLNKYKKKYDIIFHLAAWTQAGDFCLKYPGEQWIMNQLINTNTLNWWKNYQRQAKIVIMGTSCAYDPKLIHKEKNYMKGEPIDSLYTYAMTKKMLFQGVRSLHKQFGMRYLCLVPSTLYGPGYHLGKKQMHFIFDVIRKIILAKKLNKNVELWGDGYQKRELVYVDDFVKIMYELVNKIENDIINIGAGRDYSIREFAKKICEILNYDHTKIYYNKNKYTGAKKKFLQTDKVKKLIKNYMLKQTSLNEGLKKTTDWFEVN